MLGIIIACSAFAEYTPAGPREDIYYKPIRELGNNITGRMNSLGTPADFRVKKGGSNPHSGEPVILVTLVYPDVEATFWLNGAKGDSILIRMMTATPLFLERLALPFSVLEKSTWTALGEPAGTEESTVRYRYCGDSLCSYLEITTNEGVFVEMTWIWEID